MGDSKELLLDIGDIAFSSFKAGYNVFVWFATLSLVKFEDVPEAR